ncbi:hypothetical protein PsAD2_01182 [Pseudovibrio axinellae]|uniref:Phosphonate metabolism protein n=1 Tax=Pseudovibrio axinellae TaxID=989403 RepID=A0A166A7D3_9HYPH|nr:DUF1045 domain-containing protein [Pseudovibrio axinellae]KZL20694.1 hypothetical protein PsAD2_01182 [Pseudovibrio axinellae]SER25481.1 putative phosphonate metabolism protein [Pseudovibrio axinellae]
MRYSIYFSHPHTAELTQLGSQWLGRSAFCNSALPQPSLREVTRQRLHSLTEEARRYGFHATMKPPFHLAEGKTLEDVKAALHSFAKKTAPFIIEGLAPNLLGKFLALTPTKRSSELDDLAARCITEFDHLRAPLRTQDMERRRQANLTPEQDAYMQTWGYPYIFEYFRFHMTLSKQLEDESERTALKAAAEDHFKHVTNQPFPISHLALCIEREAGSPFQIIEIAPLEGTTG